MMLEESERVYRRSGNAGRAFPVDELADGEQKVDDGGSNGSDGHGARLSERRVVVVVVVVWLTD